MPGVVGAQQLEATVGHPGQVDVGGLGDPVELTGQHPRLEPDLAGPLAVADLGDPLGLVADLAQAGVLVFDGLGLGDGRLGLLATLEEALHPAPELVGAVA